MVTLKCTATVAAEHSAADCKLLKLSKLSIVKNEGAASSHRSRSSHRSELLAIAKQSVFRQFSLFKFLKKLIAFRFDKFKKKIPEVFPAETRRASSHRHTRSFSSDKPSRFLSARLPPVCGSAEADSSSFSPCRYSAFGLVGGQYSDSCFARLFKDYNWQLLLRLYTFCFDYHFPETGIQ